MPTGEEIPSTTQYPAPMPILTKKRMVELTNIALKVCDFMKEQGIKPEEYCYFGRVMQNMVNLPD
jgi:hypothetical protein